MRKPFTCEHPEDQTAMRKRITAAGTVMLGHQCGNCGRLVGKWVSLERVPKWQELPEWDYSIEPAWEKSERVYQREYGQRRIESEGVAAFAKGPDEKQRQFWAKYGDYLRSPAWAQKREQVLERDGGVCQGCRAAKATQVHHLTYERVGNELLFDLVSVCDDCHNRIHTR